MRLKLENSLDAIMHAMFGGHKVPQNTFLDVLGGDIKEGFQRYFSHMNVKCNI